MAITTRQKETVKIGPEIDAKLYEEFVQIARKNGQSQRFLLERAIEHYIRNVVPSQHTVRPEVMAAYRSSNEKFRNLYKKLAK
jgi:predicted transcriptional regulator